MSWIMLGPLVKATEVLNSYVWRGERDFKIKRKSS